VNYYPRSENNINYNAATPASKAAGEGRGPPAASRAGEERDTPLVGGSDNPNSDAPDAEDSDRNPIKNDMDEDKIVDGRLNFTAVLLYYIIDYLYSLPLSKGLIPKRS